MYTSNNVTFFNRLKTAMINNETIPQVLLTFINLKRKKNVSKALHRSVLWLLMDWTKV